MKQRSRHAPLWLLMALLAGAAPAQALTAKKLGQEALADAHKVQDSVVHGARAAASGVAHGAHVAGRAVARGAHKIGLPGAAASAPKR